MKISIRNQGPFLYNDKSLSELSTYTSKNQIYKDVRMCLESNSRRMDLSELIFWIKLYTGLKHLWNWSEIYIDEDWWRACDYFLWTESKTVTLGFQYPAQSSISIDPFILLFGPFLTEIRSSLSRGSTFGVSEAEKLLSLTFQMK